MAHSHWCAAAGLRCRFVADAPFAGQLPAGMDWIALPTRPPPGGCCRKGGGGGFFCSPHRRQTLAAQYRYLPALHQAAVARLRRSPLRWVVLLDDDSFVFAGNLLRLLARHDHRQPVLLGELRQRPGARGAAYACGGAGVALSRAAALRLNLPHCIARLRHRCMQSDWMLADCARAHGLRFEGKHGCGSCAVATSAEADGALHERLLRGCHFLQNGGRHLEHMPTNCSSPSIVHGVTSDSRLASSVLLQRSADMSGTRPNGVQTGLPATGRQCR